MGRPRKPPPVPGDDDPRHGTGAGYRAGCPCDQCKDSHRSRQARYRSDPAALARHRQREAARRAAQRQAPAE